MIICVNMLVQEFSEKGALGWGSYLSRSEINVYFAHLKNKGTFFMRRCIVWSYLGYFSREMFSLRWSFKIMKLSVLPFRDKGIILLLIQVTFHARILDWLGHLWVKAMDEGGPQKIVSIRILNHFAIWNLPIQGLSSGNFRYMLPELNSSMLLFLSSCAHLYPSSMALRVRYLGKRV